MLNSLHSVHFGELYLQSFCLLLVLCVAHWSGFPLQFCVKFQKNVLRKKFLRLLNFILEIIKDC